MGTRRITTPVFRASFIHLLEPALTENGKHYYGLTMIFEPDADFSGMKAIFEEAVIEKWKGNPPKTGFRSPFRRGEWKSQQYPQGYDLDKHPYYEGKIIVNANTYVTINAQGTITKGTKPTLCGPDPTAIFDPNVDPLYSGMYGRAEISAYAPKQNENPGISFSLHQFQKCYDGEPLGGASAGIPTKAFDVFIPPAGVAPSPGAFSGAGVDLSGI